MKVPIDMIHKFFALTLIFFHFTLNIFLDLKIPPIKLQ